MTALYLDCFSGIAGDMLVGALIDLGAPFDAVRDGLERLHVGGFRVETRTVRRGAIAATKFDVVLDGHAGPDPGAVHSHDHGHEHEHEHEHEHRPARGLREIEAILTGGGLPARVRDRALAAFRLLAEAEGKVHGLPPEEVHFHEVGAVDAICDIVGACLALEALGVDRIFVGPLRVGSGFVTCEHGKMPVPAPGTLGCLAGFDVRFEEGRGELVTPTGACLLGALAEPRVPPAFRVARVGHGAGTRDPADVPNVLRAVLGDLPDSTDAEPVVEISANLDHLPPTVLAAAMDRLFDVGALDAFVVPCTMKKGRSGHLVTVLATESAREAVEAALFAETGTLGLRRRTVERTVLEREFETVGTPWGEVRVKIGRHRGRVTSRVPEFDDCRTLADRHGVPVAEVIEAARAAAWPQER